MSRLTAVAILVLSVPVVGRAQTSKDYAAWFAIMETPAGAFAPAVVIPKARATSGMNSRTHAATVHFATWRFNESGEDPVYNVGFGFMSQLGARAQLGGSLGYMNPTCDQCNGEVMIGTDVHSTMYESNPAADARGAVFNVLFKGSAGFGKWTEGNLSALSLVASVPFVLRNELSNGSTLGLFVSPGFGFGRMSGTNTESGTRPMLGGGCSFTAANGGAAHFGVQKVFIKDPGNFFPATYGLTFSFQP